MKCVHIERKTENELNFTNFKNSNTFFFVPVKNVYYYKVGNHFCQTETGPDTQFVLESNF